MKNRLVTTLALLVSVIVFAVQNAAIVEIKLLFWEVAFPRSLLIFLTLMVGILIGWFSSSMFRLGRARR